MEGSDCDPSNECCPNPCPLLLNLKRGLFTPQDLFSTILKLGSTANPKPTLRAQIPPGAGLRIVSEKTFTPLLICLQLGERQVFLSTRSIQSSIHIRVQLRGEFGLRAHFSGLNKAKVNGIWIWATARQLLALSSKTRNHGQTSLQLGGHVCAGMLNLGMRT